MTQTTPRGPEKICEVIATKFGGLSGVREVVLFGSCAARLQNQPGPPPRDVDILIVGVPALEEIYGVVKQAQAEVGLPVNPVFAPPHQWVKPKRGLLRRVRKKGNYLTVWRADAKSN